MADDARPFRRSRAWRDRVRRTPGGRQVLRVVVFFLGLFFVLLGLALAALPGPLTIPPILLGVWIWSSEFSWADRLLDRVRASGQEAWEAAKRRPWMSGLVTGGGLLLVAAGLFALAYYDIDPVQWARDRIGL